MISRVRSRREVVIKFTQMIWPHFRKPPCESAATKVQAGGSNPEPRLGSNIFQHTNPETTFGATFGCFGMDNLASTNIHIDSRVFVDPSLYLLYRNPVLVLVGSIHFGVTGGYDIGRWN